MPIDSKTADFAHEINRFAQAATHCCHPDRIEKFADELVDAQSTLVCISFMPLRATTFSNNPDSDSLEFEGIEK